MVRMLDRTKLRRTVSHQCGITLPKRKDPIFDDPRYAVWRVAVLARAGHQCQGPKHQGDRRVTPLFADHIKERIDGGAPFDVNNGQALCRSCHVLKTNAARRQRFVMG